MSRIVCLDLRVGQRLRVFGREYVVARVTRTPSRIQLKNVGEDYSSETFTLDMLATLVVREDAELVDEREDPETFPRRSTTNLAALSPHRLFDLHARLFLLRELSPMRCMSPKGERYRAAYRYAASLLQAWYEHLGLTNVPLPTCWTMYQAQRRWRSAGYRLDGLFVKGVEYRPWSTRAPIYVRAREEFTAAFKADPSASVASLHRAVTKALRGK